MSESLSTAVAAAASALFFVAGFYIYLRVIRQIGSRVPVSIGPEERTYGWPEVGLALGLATLFLFNAIAAASQGPKMVLRSNDLIANGLISLALLVFVAAFLKLRGMSVTALAGLSTWPLWRVILTAIVLLFAAYPLIFMADVISQRILGTPSSKQDIVQLFSDSQNLEQRALIIFLAVVIAPLVEEFVFRFFLYGVLKRYLGRFVGLFANAILFAAVHAHLPSATPLFVLGVCFTLAYEWSGSILVSMTMHALFNALTLTALAFPELVPQ